MWLDNKDQDPYTQDLDRLLPSSNVSVDRQEEEEEEWKDSGLVGRKHDGNKTKKDNHLVPPQQR